MDCNCNYSGNICTCVFRYGDMVMQIPICRELVKKMSMIEKIYRTEKGPIHYWISSMVGNGPSLIFLPGLTADHRLFEKQTEYFDGKYRMFVWDAPGHASSYPFQMDFSLADKAKWLDEIIELEGMNDPVIIGQSMGGYAGQMYSQLFPEKLRGFISIDSAPLQRQYLTGAELWLLKRMEAVYRHYPWKQLLKQGTNGVAESEYGRTLMHSMMMTTIHICNTLLVMLISQGRTLVPSESRS